MAVFKLPMKKRRVNSGLMSAYDVDVTGRDIRRHQQGTMGPARFVGSWIALLLGLFSVYTAIHYIPAFRSVDVVESEQSRSDVLMDVDDSHPLTPYLDHLQLKRTYVKPGSTLSVQYRTDGKPVDLFITQCRNIPVLEVYRCDPIAVREVNVRDRSGRREFQFLNGGFYHLSEKAGDDARYRVVWRRT